VQRGARQQEPREITRGTISSPFIHPTSHAISNSIMLTHRITARASLPGRSIASLSVCARTCVHVRVWFVCVCLCVCVCVCERERERERGRGSTVEMDVDIYEAYVLPHSCLSTAHTGGQFRCRGFGENAAKYFFSVFEDNC
jgi:hypothetical protein